MRIVNDLDSLRVEQSNRAMENDGDSADKPSPSVELK